ncbi:MAG: OB-fold domain-containing protein [Candidatus Tectomicrobia bacterium]|uniref:OB-fold domain-containing protein n=1 Tax=Tectimicrobiota bacterium TaxID=2528274 RepID=A0A932HX60_UNCTE|nr:OB-fold domain-containing protein [Candidatus Tectomicrobia bacterium]
MAGIVSVGAYVPFYRLGGEAVRAVWGAGDAKASRPVAGFDEDAITLGVEALINAAGWGEAPVGALYLASTSLPYAEKSNAAVLAAAADLPETLYAADLTGSLRAGTSALLAALDAVKAGSAERAAVVASEVRPARPGGPDELAFCDAAAAVIVGQGEDVAAEVEAVHSWTEDFIDRWRIPGEGEVLAGDAKFIQDYGYIRQTAATVEGLLKKTGATREDIARVLVYAPDARTHAGICAKLGFPQGAYPERPLVARLGDAGAAAPLLALVEALQGAEPGEHILVAGHGSGGDALLLRATEKVHQLRAARGVAWSLERARPLSSYGKWLRFRGMGPEEEIRPFSSPSILWKESRASMRLRAGKCRKCGEVQYPRQRVCNGCGTKDQWDEKKLSRRGKIYTFTHDYLPPSPEGYISMATADLDGGGRFYAQMTDHDKKWVKVGAEVELVFRLLHRGDGYYNYFWKLRPA